jgi:transcriptional/translational regulatory protein YebC/TACO1
MGVALDAGAEDVINNDDGSIEVITAPTQDFSQVLAACEAAGLKPDIAEITMKAATDAELAGEDGEKMQKLLDALEDLDDVQNVYTNALIG